MTETAQGTHEARATSKSGVGIKAKPALQKCPFKDAFSRFSFENKFLTTSQGSPPPGVQSPALGLLTVSLPVEAGTGAFADLDLSVTSNCKQ